MTSILQSIHRRARKLPTWAPSAAILAGGLVLGTSIAYALGSAGPRYPVTTHDADGIRALVRPLADVMGWPELEDFLAAKAYTESRFNPLAGECSSNQACGLFGMRAVSADVEDFGFEPEDLHDARLNAVTAADYAWRLGHKSYHFAGQHIDWGAIFRGWALPKLVADADWSEERSQDVLDRAEVALAKTGQPDSFLDRTAYPPGSRHPGRVALLQAMNLPTGALA